MKQPREPFSISGSRFEIFISGNGKMTDLVEARNPRKRSLILLKRADLEEILGLVSEALDAMDKRDPQDA